jgi:putative ATPase
MQPLAYRIRPKKFEDVIGQDHLVGKNGVIKKMLDSNNLCSMILYGPAGCGKTSIASIIADMFPLTSFSFNVSTDSKNKLKEIADSAKYHESTICIIDEIHRMKKDIQDFLLPFAESGSLIIIGLTTENPYRSINPAIRSRCHIYRMNEISKDDIISSLKRIVKNEGMKELSDEIYNYLATASSCEVRTALNMLEITEMLDEKDINLENVEKLVGKKAFQIDREGEYYYDCASAMIKSIRGSDPDAALHYLARLLQTEDLEFIARRLLISAYEDIGLGNPNVGPRVYAACEAALHVGLPEARIPLAYAVVDLATSPKSNSAYNAIAAALDDVRNHDCGSFPRAVQNKHYDGADVIDKGQNYLYPHDFPNHYVKQQYLPDDVKKRKYYQYQDNKYEQNLKEYWDKIKKGK